MLTAVVGTRRDGYGSHRGVKADTVMRPTRAEGYAKKLWPQVLNVVAQRWQARYGDDVIEALRGAFDSALVSTVTPMPWSLPEVYPPNGFRTHVVVGNGDADDVGRPLVALFGQVLTALTVDHENAATVALPLSANVLRVTGQDVVPIRDPPALTGLPKEGIAMAAGWLQRHGLATTVERTIRLTPRGA